jgi:hypothetical protein
MAQLRVRWSSEGGEPVVVGVWESHIQGEGAQESTSSSQEVA